MKFKLWGTNILLKLETKHTHISIYLSIYTNTKSGKIAQSCLEKININEFPIRFGVDSNSKIHFGDQTPPYFPYGYIRSIL